jgi:hypothetical protein
MLEGRVPDKLRGKTAIVSGASRPDGRTKLAGNAN